MKRYSLIEKFLVAFLQNEVKKTGLDNALVGLSGGLDSAVVAVLLKKAFNANLTAVMMPSSASSSESVSDAKALCEKFDIDYVVEPIGELVSTYFKNKTTSPMQKGNFAARMRMATLYDLSVTYKALVIGTSNKSELMLGYGTIYGDLASAINPIGDIYKSDLFGFAKYLGVNDAIVQKAPSADLWEGQSDEKELGFTYAQIDKVLIDFVENRLSEKELLEKGYEGELVKMIQKRIYQNQFKRRLPIIAKLSNRTIGYDFLYPRDIKL